MNKNQPQQSSDRLKICGETKSHQLISGISDYIPVNYGNLCKLPGCYPEFVQRQPQVLSQQSKIIFGFVFANMNNKYDNKMRSTAQIEKLVVLDLQPHFT